MSDVLSEMSDFCVRAGCEIRFASYGTVNASQCLSDKPLVCTCISRKLYRSFMDGLEIKRLLYYQRHSLSGLELHDRFNWRGTNADMHRSMIGRSLIHRVYTASPCIHHDVMRNYTWQLLHMTTKLMWVVTAYYTPHDDFTANDASLYMYI